MPSHLLDWIDRVPGWLIAILALCGLLTAAVGDHLVLALVFLAIAIGLATYRYHATFRNSDLWAFEEWLTARKAALGIREWRSTYQAAALYCTPAIVQARDEAAREMNLMMMELVRGDQKAPALAPLGSTTNGSTEPSRLTQQARYEAAKVRHDQANTALGRELAAQLVSGVLMAKGLLVSDGAAKSERIIATARWRLLELNIAKSEASGAAGEYAGIVIGQPTVKPPAQAKAPARPTQAPAPRSQMPSPTPRPPVAGERPVPDRR